MTKDAETIGYLTLSNNNELRSIRIKIRAFTYKVSVLLKDHASNGNNPSELVQFGSSSDNLGNENKHLEKSHFQSIPTGLDCATQSINCANRNHYQGFSESRLTQTLSTNKPKSAVFTNRTTGSKKSDSQQAALISLQINKRMSNEKNRELRKIIYKDINEKNLKAGTVRRWCSTLDFAKEEVEPLARCLDYNLNNDKAVKFTDLDSRWL